MPASSFPGAHSAQSTHAVHSLRPFPPDGGDAAVEIVLCLAADGGLCLDYELRVTDLLIPPPAPPARTDGLWRHTCCELFIATVDAPRYREFNFSPSGEWTVHDFADYRQPLAATVIAVPPESLWQTRDADYCLQATIPAALLPPGPWQIGLAVVLEHRAGELSYWALHHPGERPDFHRRDAFTLLIDPLQL